MTPLAVAAGRRSCSNRSISPSRRAHSSKPRRTLMQRLTDGTDRQTDGGTPYHHINPAAYYASSVKGVRFKLKQRKVDGCSFVYAHQLGTKHLVKFGYCRFGDTRADRHADRQADTPIAIIRTPPVGQVKSMCWLKCVSLLTNFWPKFENNRKLTLAVKTGLCSATYVR